MKLLTILKVLNNTYAHLQTSNARAEVYHLFGWKKLFWCVCLSLRVVDQIIIPKDIFFIWSYGFTSELKSVDIISISAHQIGDAFGV